MPDLPTRLAEGTSENADGLLFEAFDVIYPGDMTTHRALGIHTPETNFADKFKRLMDIGTEPARVGAAMMLVPEGTEYDMTNLYNIARVTVEMNSDTGPFYGENKGNLMSLAIALAAYNAHIAGKDA